MDPEPILVELTGSAILKTLKEYELVDIHSPKFEVTRIANESINKNYKVSDGQQTLLLKTFNKQRGLPLNRRKVFQMQEELAILGLAPVPLFLNEENTIYCEKWVEYSTPNKSDIVKSLADSIYCIHSSFVSAPLLELDAHWLSYWQKIKNPSELLQKQYDLAKLQWQHYVHKHKDQFVLCHNDLHYDHLSYSNGPIFDWEYAGLGCRYFDIASCCAINNLDPQKVLELCKQYAELANQDSIDVIEKVTQASWLVDFTYDLWGVSLGIINNR